MKEMERAVNVLKLNGFLVNSHTENGDLDEPRYRPIHEAAEALGRPLFIHPRGPVEPAQAGRILPTKSDKALRLDGPDQRRDAS